MRGRVTSVLLFVVLLSLPSLAQSPCPWTARFSGQFRTTALDLAIDGPFVWLATGYGVQLLEQNRVVDSIAIPGLTRVIEANGTGIAWAGSGSRIHVLRREGKKIRLLRSVAASGTVNDILSAGFYLFVATSSGIDHFGGDPENPAKTNAFLATSLPNVTSLAVYGSTLYAADGDPSLEMFTIAIPSIPQGTGSLDTVRASSVHVTPDGLVLASDNLRRNTDLFSGTTRLARLPFAAMSFAGSPQGQFVAGPDRTLLGVDFSTPARIAELMEVQLPPTDGSDNSIHAMERSGNTLYVAAGDIGLVLLDISSITRPWPLVSYGTGGTNSVVASGDQAWFSDAAGKIWQERIVTTGLSLNDESSWNAGGGSIVRDVQDQTVLTTNGAAATRWSPAPAPSSTTTFASAISNAVLRGSGLVALLADGSVWTALPPAAPVRVSLPKMSLLARSGSSIAFAEVSEQSGRTTLHVYANGDFTTEPRRFTIDGTPVGNLALGAGGAAIFTFKGISVADFTSGTVRVIPDSNRVIPRQLAYAGASLLAADSRTLLVYDDARTLVRQHALPATVVSLAATPATAVMATSDGMAAATLLGRLPEAQLPFRSSFYTKLAAGTDRIYLFGDEGVDVFRTTTNDVVSFLTGIRAQGLVDLAATGSTLFTLGANGTVTSYSRNGAALAQVTLDEGAGAQPLRIDTAGNAVWVSYSKGCSTGTCEQKTLVLDPASLLVTSSMAGGIDDVAVAGTRAYALSALPDEIRVVNIADPLHPVVLVSATRPAPAKSIAAAAGKVYVLGEKVYAYTESTLAAAGDFLSSVPAGRAARIRIDGLCAVVSGRSENAETYRLPEFAAVEPPAPMPSPIQSFQLQSGRIIFLTGHSIELWSTEPPRPPSKRRAAQ